MIGSAFKEFTNNKIKNELTSLAKQALGISGTANSNSVRIFLQDQETKEELTLPVNPPEINLKWNRHMETVNVLNLGEVDFTTGRKLQEISFSSFFPVEYSPSYCVYADIPLPLQAYYLLEGWTNRQNEYAAPGRPVRLIITGALNINMLVLITSLECKEKGGEPGDIYFSLSCREWREVKVRLESEAANKNRTSIRPRPKLVKKVLKPGERVREMLFKTAKYYTGNSGNWKTLYNLNKKDIHSLAGIKLL